MLVCVFFHNNTYNILSQQPVYIEVLRRRPNYKKALDLKRQAATTMAMEKTNPPAVGRRGVVDVCTRMD